MISSYFRGPKAAKRDLDLSVTERPAKSEDEKGNPDHANGGTKREWIRCMADPVAVRLHDTGAVCGSNNGPMYDTVTVSRLLHSSVQ